MFSPSSQLIASIYKTNRDFNSTQIGQIGLGIFGNQLVDRGERAWTAEARHLYRTGRLRLTSGFGYFQSDRITNDRRVFQLPFPPFTRVFSDESTDDAEQTNAYVYSEVNLTQDLTLVIGGSADFYERQLFSRGQFNPKLGATWTPGPSTTIRIASFRSLNRALASSQTIEPTQVAGFNQFFAGFEGDEARRYGVAIDQEITKSLFGGVEYARRDLVVPIEFTTETETMVERLDRAEQQGRSSLNLGVPRPPVDGSGVSV